MCRIGTKTLRDTLTMLTAQLAVMWIPWGVRVLEEAISHSSSSGCAVRQTLQQPQISTPSQGLRHQAGSFWKLPSCQAKLSSGATMFS